MNQPNTQKGCCEKCDVQLEDDKIPVNCEYCPCHTPPESKGVEWETELWGLLYDEYGDVGQNGNIRDFIRNLLTTHRTQLLQEIEGEIDNNPICDYENGHNDGLRTALTIIRNKQTP